MILGRLSVRQKLSLLLMVPLIMVVVLIVPFVADRATDARTASSTATAADTARAAAALVQDLQRERLLQVGYLATPGASRSPVLQASQAVRDRTVELQTDLGRRATGDLSAALTKVDGLSQLRPGVLSRTAQPRAVFQVYTEAINGVLSSLGLLTQQEADAAGGRQVGGLNALLRSNEAGSAVGAAFVVSTVDANTGRALLAEATAAQRLHTEAFLQLAAQVEADLFRTVDTSQATFRVNQLLRGELTAPDPVGLATIAVGAFEAQSTLRRLVQDRIAQQINAQAGSAAANATIAAIVVGAVAVILFALVIALIVAVSRSIARPLRRLSRAATAVADLANAELVRVSDDESPERETPRLAAIDIGSQDEIGELAVAFNRVQATAALLLERQLISRRNVATMFASVGRRTQNLVGRQLSMIEDLERNETDPDLLAGLYRIDHVSARLRRTAYSLLVVAGAAEESYGAEPLALATVIRSALSEIEGFQEVQLGDITNVTVSANLVSDLALLLAELLENATSFSPPGSPVTVRAHIDTDHCRISVIDHGIGMPPEQLAQENRRLVERERLDIVPTSVLGLFVVGRLSRRHGLSVRLAPTSGRGVTALVDIPISLLVGGVAAPAPPEPSYAAILPPAAAFAGFGSDPPPNAQPMTSFPWFSVEQQATLAGAFDSQALAVPPTMPLPALGPGPSGPPQRPPLPGPRPAAPAAGPQPPIAAPPPPPMTAPRPAPPRAAAPPPAAGPPPAAPPSVAPRPAPSQPTPPAPIPSAPAQPPRPPIAVPPPAEAPVAPMQRGGLTRRVPSAQLFDVGSTRSTERPPERDPAAARAAIEEFEAGAARATRDDVLSTPSTPRPAPQIQEPAADEDRNGLTRRVPGAHLAAALRGGDRQAATFPAAPSRLTSPAAARTLDPTSERDTLNAFLDGFAEGTGTGASTPSAETPQSTLTTQKEGGR